MNPSSLDISLSAVQRQKDMYKLFASMLFDDEGCSYSIILLAVLTPSSSTAFRFASSLRSVRRTSFKNNYGVRQLVTCSLNDIYSIIYQVVK